MPQILERLAGFASSEDGKEYCRTLTPVDTISQAEIWQDQASAAREMLEQRGSPGLSGIRRIKEALVRTQMGGVLSTRELLNIASVLSVARGLKRYATGQDNGALAPLLQSISGNNQLEEQISTSIIGENEISDNASHELSSIRRRMKAVSNKIRDILQKYITSSSYSKFLQDTIVTQRSSRNVIPVKAEHKGDIPGLVHDVSSSGATIFIEPLPVVHAGNELRELEGAEQKEINRILSTLSLMCDESRDDILRDYDAMTALDLIFAKAKLSSDMQATRPRLNDRGVIEYRNARHPLLDPQAAVPISVRLGKDFDTLVITGPNTGGKTVSLKTIGLLTLMANCGLHIPVSEDSEAPIISRIYSDIGDEQSIAQSLSTFSSHMTNIVKILEAAQPGDLILLDELGAGTDPVEGAALAVAIIEEARRKGALTAATTHYAELKSYAIVTEKVENACQEFDVETLRPTYRLLIGIPGKSNAFAISRRLGLDENIIRAAELRLDREESEFEEVLSHLEQERSSMEAQRISADADRRQAQQDRRLADEYRKKIEREHQRSTERARIDAMRILENAREEADSVMRELSVMRVRGTADNQEIVELRKTLNTARDLLSQSLDLPKSPDDVPMFSTPPEPGQDVILTSTGTRAVVLSPPDKNGKVSLQAGRLKMNVPLSDLHPSEKQPEGIKDPGGVSVSRSFDPIKLEIDLRGEMTEEGVMLLEQFIDNAVMNKVKEISVIHGKGTGALRTAVQQALRRNKAVKNFRLGRYGEGESGVTIAELK
ncbi:MAG: endonuclease MutS2 [Oscillospiraceae bacterium]|nr:endonuclease MutS2 [Oscillospiraceae bacterium]